MDEIFAAIESFIMKIYQIIENIMKIFEGADDAGAPEAEEPIA